MRRISMSNWAKKELQELVKEDEIATDIADKIINVERRINPILMNIVILFKKIKNIVSGKDDMISHSEESYLNDMLRGMKVYEKYPVAKKIKSNIYYYMNNELKVIEYMKRINHEPDKVIFCYYYQIKRTDEKYITNCCHYILDHNLISIEVE